LILLKNRSTFYGYKNHVNVDAKHKLIRHYEVTDASVHDSRKFYGLLNKANTSADGSVQNLSHI
jgi:hypothetical protein